MLFASAAHAQVSPGPLAAAHAPWDGTLQCFQCHAPGRKGTMDERCLACHKEIASMKTSRRGYHARVTETCAKCHPDHAGRDFAMVAWEGGSAKAFDHAKAGWPLEGKHASVDCRACHKPAYQRSPVAKVLRVKDRTRTWLGLEQACASCHEDVHRGQLGQECQRCHDLKGWKPAPGFDHAKSRYPLTGKHADVACAKCHLAPALQVAHDVKGAPVSQYRPLPFAECSSCHKDPHAGRLGAGCAKCHATDNWQHLNQRGFDHDRTRYPLRGKHAAVVCAKCHLAPGLPLAHDASGAPVPLYKPLRFDACAVCHKDVHNGLGTLAGKPADCAACHDVKDWRPSTYTVAQHQGTPYPLLGRHATTVCAGCHAQQPPASAATLGSSRVPMRPGHTECTDCHGDPHRARFAVGGARPYAAGCVACHDYAAFRPSTVGVAAHARMGFGLEGAHRATPCQACHAELKAPAAASSLKPAIAAVKPMPLSDSPTRCDACHETPHGKQFAARRDHGACESCHGLEAWGPAPAFDHNRDSSFRLDGRHAKVACAGCHKPKSGPGSTRMIVYRPVPSRCEDCHVSTP